MEQESQRTPTMEVASRTCEPKTLARPKSANLKDWVDDMRTSLLLSHLNSFQSSYSQAHYSLA